MEKLIQNTQDIGALIREARDNAKLTQAKFAALCGVGTRFISDIENGKPTAQLDKTLLVLKALGLSVIIKPRGFGRG